MKDFKLKGHFQKYISAPLYLMPVLVFMTAYAFYVKQYTAASMLGIATVVYAAFAIVIYNLLRKSLRRQLSQFAAEQGLIAKGITEASARAVALLAENGKVLWSNQAFRKLTGKDKDFGKSITVIYPELTREMLAKLAEDKESLKISAEGLELSCDVRKADISSVEESVDNADPFYTIYIDDITLLEKYRTENEEQHLVVALVYIDNYEEAMGNVENVKRSLLLAIIERKIMEYFGRAEAIVSKLDRDKYIIQFKQKYMQLFKEDHFSLIEDIKTVKSGNEMEITLSIGIGLGEEAYNATLASASAAVEQALSRGGCQVVLKAGNEFSYYGGISKQVERNTRVKARVMAHALQGILASHDDVIVMGHKLSDADALGAAVGICAAARSMGKPYHIVLNDVSSTLRPFKDTFVEDEGYPVGTFVDSMRALELLGSRTLVMVVDTNRMSNVECPELLERAKSVVVFDHHRQSADYIEDAMLSYVVPYASSACEMVTEVLQYFEPAVRPNPKEADCMYAGIMVDTNNFVTKTGVRTFEAAAFLRRCSAETGRVRKLLREDMDAYKARAEVVRHAVVYRQAFAISQCEPRGIESPTIVGAQAANELLNIVGIKASFVLTEYQGRVFVSARSIDEINVQIIMERLGGGGHMSVAGAQIQDCTLEKAMSLVEHTIDELIEEGEIVL